ncbi:10053_t:CDS:2 [Diversispora eburnea]|uniref:10053_t:CDS:1 n=1 Tax=Diversispora eburnea TaxID=1213867 RepID=A0A9N9BBS9_9GLOM|nr:10053_t:CDS:2 [Diversispora eburnea]
MEPKNYSTIRSILKQERGEKISPYVFKLVNPQPVKEYLEKEGITYETYQQEVVNEPKKTTKEKLIAGYKASAKSEIYLVDFNRKREREIFKIRPAVVVSGDLQNEYDKQILMAPISAEEELIQKSKPRILEYLGVASPKTLRQIKETLKVVLELE